MLREQQNLALLGGSTGALPSKFPMKFHGDAWGRSALATLGLRPSWLLTMLALVLVTTFGAIWLSPTIRLTLEPPQIIPERGHAFTVDLSTVRVRFPYQIVGDAVGRANPSTLALFENGRELGPAHAPHDVIRNQGRGAFSHWENTLYFSTSDNADPRSSERQYTAVIKAVPALWLELLAACAAALGAAAVAALAGPAVIKRFVDATRALALLGAAAALLAALLYGGTVVYGVFRGDALPTATAFVLYPAIFSHLRSGPILVYWLLAIALAGMAGALLAALGLAPQRTLRRHHAALLRWLAPRGSAGILLFVVTALFVAAISMDGWAGRFDPRYPLTYMNLLGLLPHSDAYGYWTEAYSQATTGQWTAFGARRPLAQSFRDFVVLVSGFSYSTVALVQAVAVAAALWWAARSVLLWRGLWAALAFVAFGFIVAWPFVSTTMTEPMGLLVALLTIPFVVEALRSGSARYGAIALFGLSLAMMMRFGSMMTLPAAVLWGAVAFGHDKGWRGIAVRGVIGCALVAAAYAVSAGAALLYAPPGSATGGNFGGTLCGLSVGSDWSACYNRLYAADLAKLPSEQAVAKFLLQKAVENVSREPAVFLTAMVNNVTAFMRGLPNFLLSGYGGGQSWPWWILVVTVPGLAFVMIRAQPRERWFWILFWLSLLASAALIMADDGWRALVVTHPLCILFFSLAFTTRQPLLRPSGCDRPTAPLWTGAVFGAIAIAALFGPLALRIVFGEVAHVGHARTIDGNVYAGGRAMTGLIIVADGDERAFSAPVVRFSEFAKAFKAAPFLEKPDEFLDRLSAKLPAAIIDTPPLNSRTPRYVRLLAAPAMLEQLDVPAWRVTFGESLSDYHFFQVTEVASAMPIR